MGSRGKTSIYIDRELWEKFRRYARSRGVEVSRFLEELIREGILEDDLADALSELSGEKFTELDFQPIRPRGGLVSGLVRELRDKRADSLSG